MRPGSSTPHHSFCSPASTGSIDQGLAPAILVQNAVIEEVRGGQHKDLTAAREMEWAGEYRVEDIAVATSIEDWDLGTGEAQVIAHCTDAPRWAVLHDRAARRCAAAHDVRVSGTLGVILGAKKRGQVESARPLVKKLVAAGMFIGEEFLEGVLASIGE